MSTSPPSFSDESTRLSPRSSGVLSIEMPDGSRLDFPLLTAEIKVGRAPDNDLILDHASVSRYHARLTVDQGRLFIEDLGSSNGTYIGDQKLPPRQRVDVPHTQLFEIGQVRVTFQSYALPPASPSAQAARPTTLPAASGMLVALRARLAGLSLPVRLLITAAALTGVLGVAFACLVIGVSAIFSRGSAARLTAECEQPPMVLLNQGGNAYAYSYLQTAVPSSPLLSQPTPAAPLTDADGALLPLLTTAFLEIPFPYDGGNENFGGTLEQFRLAMQRNTGTGGRVNSFFDHYYPLYPAPKDPGAPGGQEPAEEPIGKFILPFDGQLNPYFAYSGHPALDFSTFVYRQPTTPVFAAADGVILAVGTHGASGALYVRLRHTVANVGDFQTTYWHLHPDEFFDAMLGREGEPITAGTRIGTMGNTGFSTGHHLHFEVRFDLNQDGAFAASEVVDPFGWIPSSEFPADPWYQRSGVVSNYLWIHPLGSAAQIPQDGSGLLAQPGGTGGEYPVSACAPTGALPPGGTTLYSWAPDPEPSPAAAGVGQGCVLSVLDAQGQPVQEFAQPVKIVLPFDQANLDHIDQQTLVIYWQTPGSLDWQPLPTTLDFENQVAIAETLKPGKCALMGQPTQDIFPPETTIQISGVKSEDGSFYDEVQVSLVSSDPSGIETIFYSLDNGLNWLVYDQPFTIQPGPLPQPVLMDEEFFGGLPGTFVILASALDLKGNIEEPPAVEYFSIDISKNPDLPTATQTAPPTATATFTRTPAPTPSLTPTASLTPTPEACLATAVLTKNSNCRKGPGTVYDVFTSYFAGDQLIVEGRSADGSWLWVLAQGSTTAHCWISSANFTVTGDASCMPVIPAPPTPTPKPVDTTAPPPPTLLRPANNSEQTCSRSVTLTWSAVNDPSGIAEYQWYMEFESVSGQAWAFFNSGSTQSTSVQTSLEGCTRYRWTVRAVDNAGNVGDYAGYFVFSNFIPIGMLAPQP